MKVSQKDIQILRELASEVAKIAALPVQEETRKLWKALNSLKPERPMVAIDQIPWHEMNVGGELTLKSGDDFCRSLEWGLRETLYRWKHIRADMVVESFICIPKVIKNTGFGITTHEDTSSYDQNNSVVGHRYFDQLQTEEDLRKIKTPQISFDKEATGELLEKTNEIFHDILTVKATGVVTMFNIWDMIVTWRGVENVLYDLADRPEFIHILMDLMTNAFSAMVDQLEDQGLLDYDIPLIHCTGAYTDELPAPGFDPAKPRAKDAWTCGMSQIFATVSPAMHEEFDIQYVNRLYERFGLVYYGCCEPLDNKIGIVRKIPGLRKISISPWADVEKASSQIRGDFVVSNKPTPAYLALENWDREIVESDLSKTMTICKNHGNPLEFILKDISTVLYQPQRLWEWADIAMNLCTPRV